MRVSSTVRMNLPRIRQLTQAQITALELTAEALHSDVQQAQVVPRMDGALQGEAFFVDCSESRNGKVTLAHATPYARRLYYHPEYNFHKGPWSETVWNRDGTESHLTHDGNPNAKGKWYEDWEKGGSKQDFVKNTFKNIYKRVGGV